MGITLHIEKKGQWEQLMYAGPINEDTEVHLKPMITSLGPNVIFNFRKVEYVNSCGVRAWINFLREVQKNRKIIFEECTPEIVSQINMIPNFKGTAHIKSVYASYACDSCDAQKWVLFEEGRDGESRLRNSLHPQRQRSQAARGQPAFKRVRVDAVQARHCPNLAEQPVGTNDDSGHHVAVAVQIFRDAVPDERRAVFNRPDQTGGTERAIDQQRNRSERVNEARQIGHFQQRVRDRLNDAQFRFGCDEAAQRIWIGDVEISHLQAERRGEMIE